MQRPTKAFADMMHELANKLQAVLTEMYPDGDNQGALFVSANSLRATAHQYTEIADSEADKRALLDVLAEIPADAHPDYAAAVILHHFDVKPKGAKG